MPFTKLSEAREFIKSKGLDIKARSLESLNEQLEEKYYKPLREAEQAVVEPIVEPIIDLVHVVVESAHVENTFDFDKLMSEFNELPCDTTEVEVAYSAEHLKALREIGQQHNNIDEQYIIEKIANSSRGALTIDKRPSRMCRQFVEVLPKDGLECVLEYLKTSGDTFDSNSYANRSAIYHKYVDVSDQIKKFGSRESNGVFKVDYAKCHHGWGRVFPYKALGLTGFSKTIRNALICDTYVDFDLTNCQPAIIMNICEKNNIECRAIREYCERRDDILNELSVHYGITYSVAKKLMLRLCFFGNFYGWGKQFNIDKKETDFILEFVDNLREVSEAVKEQNYKLNEFARKQKCKDINSFDENTMSKNSTGSMFAHYLQDIELRIIEDVIIHVMETTKLTHSHGYKNVLTYEFDGFKLLKTCVDEFGGTQAVLDYINAELLNLGWKMRFENKPIENTIKLSDFMGAVLESKKSEETFEGMVLKFEENNFKVKSTSDFCTIIGGRFIIKTRADMVITYENMRYTDGKFDKNGELMDHCFIAKWFKRKTMREYDIIDVYPPGGDVCPPTHYNTWKPFYAEAITDFTYDQDAVDVFLNHIKILFADIQGGYEYFIYWIAQMFQCPSRKSGIMPFLIGVEGCGKSTIIKALRRMIGGNGRSIETSNPDDIVGDYNGLVADAYFICLNEFSKSKLGGNASKLKSLITEPTVSINYKKVNQYEINSFHRLISCTNSEVPIKIDDKSRRPFIVRCSDKLCGDKKYFEKLHEVIECDNSIASIFKYFMSIKDVGSFYKMEVPKSDYDKELRNLGTNIIDRWLSHFVLSSELKGVHTFSNKSLYSHYADWLTANMTKKYESDSFSFAMHINVSKFPGITKGGRASSGATQNINFDELKKHFEKEA